MKTNFPWKMTAIVVMGLGVLLSQGCGTTCKQISTDYDRFWARPTISSGTHVIAAVPYAFASEWLTESIQSLGDQAISLNLPKGIPGVPGGLSFRLLRVEVIPADPGQLGLALIAGVLDAQQTPLAEARATVSLRPIIDTSKGTMVWKLRGEDLESLAFRFTDSGLDQLAGFVFDKLPKNTRRLAPKTLVRGAVQTALSEFEQQGASWLKNHPFDRIGTLLTLEWSFSQLPIHDLRLSSSPTHVIAEIQLALPITDGVSPSTMGSLPPSGVRLVMGGSAVAEVANLLITKNRVPGRFDRNGEPQREGEVHAALGFVPGERPLKILTWCLNEPCVQTKIGARIHVNVQDGKISATADDPVLEELRGPALAELAVWLGAVGAPAIERSVQRAATFVILVGGKPVRWTTTSLDVAESGFVIDLAPAAAP